MMVPQEGLEPPHPKITDFESAASTNSATEAMASFIALATALANRKSGVSNTFRAVFINLAKAEPCERKAAINHKMAAGGYN